MHWQCAWKECSHTQIHSTSLKLCMPVWTLWCVCVSGCERGSIFCRVCVQVLQFHWNCLCRRVSPAPTRLIAHITLSCRYIICMTLYVVEGFKQHICTVKRHTPIAIMLGRHNTWIFAQHIADCGEVTVTTGPMYRKPPAAMMLEDTAHWRQQSELELVATVKAQKTLRSEAGKPGNFVQEIFEINIWLTSPNFYGNQTDSTGVCALFDRGIVLVQQCALSQDQWKLAMPRRRATIHKITKMSSYAISCVCGCVPELECIMRQIWDWMYSVHTKDLEWRMLNRKHLVPCLKNSPIIWLNHWAKWIIMIIMWVDCEWAESS